MKSLNTKFTVIFIGILFSPLISQVSEEKKLRGDIEKLEDEFIQDYLNTDDVRKLIGEINEKIKLNKGRNKNESIEIFLKIWEVKAYFLNGEIEKAKAIYREIENLTKEDDLNWQKILFHDPYSSRIRRCSERKCICSKIDDKLSNLDILDPYNFNQHFKDLSIEFGDRNSNTIHVEKRSVVKGDLDKKRNRNEIEILVDPPNAKYRDISYSSDFSSEDILDYYMTKAKKRRLDKLEDEYKEENKAYVLKFVDSYNIEEEKWKKEIRYLPTTSEHLEDVNRTFYKFYLRDGENIKRRYSKAIIEEDLEEEEELGLYNLNETSLLIDWETEWEMQELKDEGKLIFLFPEEYIVPGHQSAFKINTYSLSDKENLPSNIVISDSYYEELLEKFGDFSEIDDKKIKVYQVEISYDPDGTKPVKLDFTKDYFKFKEEQRRINKAMKWLYISFSLCLGVLLLI